MKKEYLIPIVEITRFNGDDVILTSDVDTELDPFNLKLFDASGYPTK